jgi:hypothetical protein
LVLFPGLLYLLGFCLLTFPLVTLFSSHYFADRGDGLQNVWNIWWIHKAVTELGQLPWFTDFLHYPYGVSLLGHTLNPLNGFIALPLLGVLSPIQAHNVIILFAFVTSGLAAFWLAYVLTRAYWGALLGGAIFTFSSYHFAHAEGHMNLIAMQWLPLFLLYWHFLVTKPRLSFGVTSALVLFLVLLCDYYYFLFGVMAAAIMLVWYGLRNRAKLAGVADNYLRPFLAFGGTLLVTSGPLIISLFLLQANDPLLVEYVPERFSLDSLALFIPGGHWRFAQLTEDYWSKLPGNIHESSVYLGWSVIFLLAYGALKRKRIRMPSLGYWYFLLFFFALLALGPVLQVGGKQFAGVPMPYDLVFQQVFPALKAARVPVRMVVMVVLSASIISAVSFGLLLRQSRASQLLAGILLLLLVVEVLPKPLPTSQMVPPAYVDLLREAPGDSAALDTVNRGPLVLYYQTIHEKPLAFGYVSRVPTSVDTRDRELRQLVEDKQYDILCREYDIRYVITDPDDEVLNASQSIKVLYRDDRSGLYDLDPNGLCTVAPVRHSP